MLIQSELDEISNMTSLLNFSEVPCIHQKRLLTFVNSFIVTTVEFLNDFAKSAESKLMECDRKIQKLEAVLCILEAKLNSIPAENGTENIPIIPIDVKTEDTDDSAYLADTSEPDYSEQSSNSSTARIENSENEEKTPPAVKSPELVRFLKMMQVGVPVPAVKLKMQQEGFDPNLLDS